jgi:uncharacterized protein
MISALLNRHGRLRNGWWIVVFYLALAALVVPASIYAAAARTEVTVALQAVMAAVATGICLALRRDQVISVTGSAASWRHGVPLGVGLGGLAWGTAAASIWLSGAVDWSWGENSRQALVNGALDCLAVAVVEELIFRGFAFQRLVDGVGVWTAQVLMAGYFVLTHSNAIAAAGELQLLATMNLFLASLLFGAAYLRTGSLALPIALHFALNFVQGPLLGFGVSGNHADSIWVPVTSGSTWLTGGAFGLEASIPGTVAITLALCGMLTWDTQGRFAAACRSVFAVCVARANRNGF